MPQRLEPQISIRDVIYECIEDRNLTVDETMKVLEDEYGIKRARSRIYQLIHAMNLTLPSQKVDAINPQTGMNRRL